VNTLDPYAYSILRSLIIRQIEFIRQRRLHHHLLASHAKKKSFRVRVRSMSAIKSSVQARDQQVRCHSLKESTASGISQWKSSQWNLQAS